MFRPCFPEFTSMLLGEAPKHISWLNRDSAETLLIYWTSDEFTVWLYLIRAWDWLTLRCLRRIDRLGRSAAMRFTLSSLSSLSSLPSSQPGLLLWAGTRCLIKKLDILGVCSWSATPHPLAMVVRPQRVHFGSKSQQGQGAKWRKLVFFLSGL